MSDIVDLSPQQRMDVIGKYNSLVKESLGADSVYARVKETIKSFVDDGVLDKAKQAEIVSGVLGSVVNGITSASMSTDLQWVKMEQDIALQREELKYQLKVVENDGLIKAEQVKATEAQRIQTQAESKDKILL
jgi:predicted transcriptional regulator